MILLLSKLNYNLCFKAVSTIKHNYTTQINQNSIYLSERCIQRLKDIERKGNLLRVLVESGGCSGFQYKFELVDKQEEGDILLKQQDATILIDSVSLDFLNGSTIDYEMELIRSGFIITNNPKMEKGCSCGVSFSIKTV